MAPAEFDYDELARRLLVQVVRRLAATPADLQQTVAALELELATAWSRHGTLTAENVRLREELVRTQRDLDSARELTRKAAVSDDLSEAEVVLLEGLLTRELAARARSPARPLAEAPQSLAVFAGGLDVGLDRSLGPAGVHAAALDRRGHARHQ